MQRNRMRPRVGGNGTTLTRKKKTTAGAQSGAPAAPCPPEAAAGSRCRHRLTPRRRHRLMPRRPQCRPRQ